MSRQQEEYTSQSDEIDRRTERALIALRKWGRFGDAVALHHAVRAYAPGTEAHEIEASTLRVQSRGL